MTNTPTNRITQVALGIFAVILLALLAVFSSSLIENVDSREIAVFQHLDGTLDVHTEPGYKLQWFADVTKYPRSFQYKFDESKIRFADGAHAFIYGSIRADLPLSHPEILDLHRTYGSQTAVLRDLVAAIVDRSIYLTGPLMTSKESYSEKRNLIPAYIQEQAQEGVYATRSIEKRIEDPLTGERRSITMVEIQRDDVGVPIRQTKSPVKEYGIKLHSLSITGMPYDEVVERQIRRQQEALMEVQTAIAAAKKAEQDAITAEREGQAAAARAKWEQEKENARLLSRVEAERKIAEIERDKAQLFKEKQILEGEGESERKKMIMAADGALEKKLAAWESVNKAYAEAISNMKHPIVPRIIMGKGSETGSTTAQDILEMIKVKTARELAVDVEIKR